MRKLLLIVTTVIFSFTLNSVFAAEIEVKMLNKDADGNKTVSYTHLTLPTTPYV